MNLPKILKYARKASLKSDHPDHRIGAVLTNKRGHIISVGYNFHKKTHPIYNKIAPLKTLHAEASVILGIRHITDFKDTHLFVYRETADGKPAMSRPCVFCMQLIKNYGIKHIWYTTAEGIKKVNL